MVTNKLITCFQDLQQIITQLQLKIKKYQQKYQITPRLLVITLGNHPASNLYINNKKKVGNQIGVLVQIVRFPITITTAQLSMLLNFFNQKKSIHGILVQLPLPPHLHTVTILENIDSKKDVDGLTSTSLGKLALGSPTMIPPTVQGVQYLCQKYSLNLTRKVVVLVGQGLTTNYPMMFWLKKKKATIISLNKNTIKLAHYVKQADIVITATGVPGLITDDMVAKNTIIIDLGCQKIERKIYGDVLISEKLLQKIQWITAVPGGIGQLTLGFLFINLCKLYQQALSINS